MTTAEQEPRVSADAGPDTPGAGGYAGKAATGVLWTTAQTWAIRFTGFVSVAILARLLSPSDFGVVAIASALLPMVQFLADLGFSTYIVQAREVTNRTLSTVFWYSTTAGALVAALLVVGAPVVGAVVDTPEVVPVIRALAPVAILVTVGAVPMTLLRRNMRFQVLAVQSVVAGIAGQVVAIVLALTGAGVWALVWQSLTVQAVVLVMAWITARWRPTLEFSRRELGVMARFGAKVVGKQVGGLAAIWVVNAVIVNSLGTAGLGYLNIAQRLVTVAHDLTSNALTPVSMVVFARIRESVDRLRSGYLRALSVSYAVVNPVMIVVVVSAPTLVPLVFGEQWEMSIGPARALAVAGLIALSGLDEALFLGLGKPGAWWAYYATADVVTIVMALFVVPYGIFAYSIGFLAVGVAATVARWVLVGKQLKVPWWRVAGPMMSVLPAAVLASAAGLGVSALSSDLPPLAVLALTAVAIFGVYLPALRLSAHGVWVEVAALGRGLVGKFRVRKPVTP